MSEYETAAVNEPSMFEPLKFYCIWGGRVVRRCWVNFQCRGVLLTWITVGQGPIVLAVGAGGGCLDIFSLIYQFSFLSPSLWETARYRLKYCLKGPLSPKQPTKKSTVFPIFSLYLNSCYLKLLLSQSKFILRYQKFETNFAFEISRADCKIEIEASLQRQGDLNRMKNKSPNFTESRKLFIRLSHAVLFLFLLLLVL